MKYTRVDTEAGRIISAYFTHGNEEKLKHFVPFWINVGNPNCAKELVGLRKNTTFLPSSGKGKFGHTFEDNPRYLVLSFENRKKANSPFVEYSLNKLDPLIKALMELKNIAIQNGYYNEGKLINGKYPENTKLTSNDFKDTTLPSFEN